MIRCSVIIPCYNAEAYLDAAIESCLTQTVSDLEVLVIDDGSTDRSAAIAADAAARDARVSVLHQTNKGVGAARNAGLSRARGRFVNFLDADDRLEPDKLALQAAVLVENPAIGLVLCDGQTIDQDNRVLWETLVDRRRFEGHAPLFEILFRGGAFPPLVPLVRRELAASVGGFDEDRRSAGWADTGFWMRVALTGADYHFIDRPLVRYRSTSTSMSTDREGMEHAATTVYANIMAAQPMASARALRVAQGRLRDLERAAEDLRIVIGTLMAKQEALTTERDQLLAVSQRLESELYGVRRSRRAAWSTLLQLLPRRREGTIARPLMIWGAGAGGRMALALLQRTGATADAFIDRDPAKAGSVIDGVPVVNPAAVEQAIAPRPFVLIASVHALAIEAQLQGLGWQSGVDYHVADFEAAELDEDR